MKTVLTGAILLALACPAAAWAQGKGGDFGKDGKSGFRLDWYGSVEKAISRESDDGDRKRRAFLKEPEPSEKKYIFVYVRATADERDPGEFQTQDVLSASRDRWCFVRMEFDRDNARLKSWGVRGAPAIIGCDMKGNDFVKSATLSSDQVKRVLLGTPEEIQRHEQKLRADSAKAMDLLRTDEARAVRTLVEIVVKGKQGYKEVTEAQVKLNELAETFFRRGEVAESLGPDAGVEYYDELAKAYRGTPPGARAEIRAARLDHERGGTKTSVQRLQAVVKLDPGVFKAEIDEAQKALDEIAKAGK